MVGQDPEAVASAQRRFRASADDVIAQLKFLFFGSRGANYSFEKPA